MSFSKVSPKFLYRALELIGRKAQAADLRVEVAVCQRACFVTAFLKHGRPRAFAVPNGRARALVEEAGEELRFAAGWLDADLAPWLTAEAASGRLVMEARSTGVMLSVNEGARILAHKLAVLGQASGAEDSDAADAKRLLRGMRGLNEEQVEALYRRHCPEVEWSAAARRLVAASVGGVVAVREAAER